MLSAGTRLGPYEVVAPLGAGGMGEVYRALDKRLDRTVAIKVLPSHAAVDPAFRERFEREARAVSALNHPHICALYDVGTAPSVDPGGPEIQFLVMEFVEGETLEARLAGKPSGLPVREALPIAIQIADALDKAHRAGIVHRDLKPGNVIITKSGAGSTSSPQAKLLDFGLAKSGAGGAGRAGGAGGAGRAGGAGGAGRAGGAGGAGTEHPDLSALVTAPGTLTVQGTLLGTVQYMSPEQVEGREADTRSDLFAFGALLYEMVTGRKAFAGKSQASVMVAILEQDPPAMATLQPLAPPALDYIVSRCLAKDPDDRWQTARDLLAELRRTADLTASAVVPAAVGAPRARGSRRRELVAWFLAVASIVAASAMGMLYVGRTTTTAPAIRFELPTSGTFSTSALLQLALSPDGRTLAYVASNPDGRPLIMVRPLGEVAARSLTGTDNPVHPFWSPDSHSIGFFSGGKLKTIDLAGGPPHTVCDVQSGYGGTWGADGVILFGTDGPLMRVSATGGEAVAVTTLDSAHHETGHRWPFFLPDGRRFLYQAWISQLDVGGIYLGAVGSKDVRRLTAADGGAQYAPPGYLLFPRDTTLVSQRFDVERGELAGDVARVADDLAMGVGNGKAAFTVSATGILALRSGGLQGIKTGLTWFDRGGKRLGTVGVPGDFRNPSLSPDGKRVAIDRSESPQTNSRDVWIYDLASGNPSRFTFETSDESDVVWSPDGQRIAFGSRNTDGVRQIRIKPASGLGQEEVIVDTQATPALAASNGLFPRDWSQDGRFILFDAFGMPGAGTDVWFVALSGDRKPQPLLQTPANEAEARLSPDGRWLVYQSNASGRPEIYAQPFPITGAKFQISNGGGVIPRWRSDGRELYFYGADGTLMAVDVRPGSTFETGVPKPLFPTSFSGLAGTGGLTHYGVSGDGQRFLVNVPVDQSVAPIRVVVNWPSALPTK